MDQTRAQLLNHLMEKARLEVLANVTEQYTEEAKHNYEQYIKSVHAASVSLQIDEEKLKEEFRYELNETSRAVENYLKAKFGRIPLVSDQPTTLDNLRSL